MSDDSVPLRFELLGPMRVWRGEHELALGWPKQRAVLAVLATRTNRIVSRDELVDAVWEDQPPRNASSDIYTYVSRLRRLLEPGHSPRAAAVLATGPGGYLLRVAAESVDTIVFERHLGRAHRLRAAGDHAGTAAALAAALGLWHGTPLGGVPGPFAQVERVRLGELRLTAIEHQAAAMLALGRHAETTAELSRLVREHPLHERLWIMLMLALYRGGRAADALATFQEARRTMIEQVGIEPGPELRRLHERILAADPALDAPHAATGPPAAGPPAARPDAGTSRPAQLPHNVPDFTGRERELRQLEAVCRTLDDAARTGSVALVALDGMAGVGKTALAVHWAHRLAERFPDGQLYADLCGHHANQAPLETSVVLGRFLRALGVQPGDIPADVDEQAALYRSLLADRRVLVTLDNAASARQVRHLVPGSDRCLVVVTSRTRLGGLVREHGAQRVEVGVLQPEESLDLLVRILGPQRVHAERDAAAALCQLCDHLPLALRIVAGNLAGRPHATLAAAVTALTRGDRLAMTGGDGEERSAVRAAFDMSYWIMPAVARRLFRLLGLVPGPDFDPHAAAALAAAPEAEVTETLDLLAAAHLAEQHAPARYRLHDLLRVYAAERVAAEENTADRDAALRRLLDWYLHATDAVARSHSVQLLRLPRPAAGPDAAPDTLPAALPEALADQRRALSWLEAERPNLLAAIHLAADRGPYDAAWSITDALRGFFRLRPYGAERLAAANAGLRAARRAGDLRAEAAMHLNLADAFGELGQYQVARSHDVQALAACRQVDWTEGEAAALSGLGTGCWTLGQLDEALGHLTEALNTYRRLGHRHGEAACLGSLARAHQDKGQLEPALRLYTESWRLSEEVGSQYGAALALFFLGSLHRDLGDHEQGTDLLRRALAIGQRSGLLHVEALSVAYLSLACLDAGDVAAAEQHLRHAVRLEHRTGDRRVEAECRSAVADSELRLDRPVDAATEYQHALAAARAVQYRRGEIRALIGLARARLRLGAPQEAAHACVEALGLAGESDYRLRRNDALLVLAELQMQSGGVVPAVARDRDPADQLH